MRAQRPVSGETIERFRLQENDEAGVVGVEMYLDHPDFAFCYQLAKHPRVFLLVGMVDDAVLLAPLFTPAERTAVEMCREISPHPGKRVCPL